MTSADIAFVAAAVGAFALVSRRFERTWLTAPLAFLVLGVLVGTEGLDIVDLGNDPAVLRHLAEATLTLVLFSDASSLDLTALRHRSGMPVRLLAIGLPLTIALGSVIAGVMFSGLVAAEAVVLAVLLAPTDAALGQTVVSDERLPTSLRQGLNVESGLNDGVCVPILFAAIAVAELESGQRFEGHVLADLGKELVIAGVTGLVIGLGVAWLRGFASARDWIDHRWARVIPLAAAALSYTLTVELGGSGFIAAFVAGLAYGSRWTSESDRRVELVEEVGSALSAATFLLFSAILVGPVFVHVDAATVVYAVLSLTLIRMLPVAISLIGSGASWATTLYAGWFGPRGLATIVFALTVVDESGLAGTPRIVRVATVVVTFSIIAHGVSAPFLTDKYVAALPAEVEAEPD
jgi:NhaP-type Na+/H+ or K+/H+ antiporter